MTTIPLYSEDFTGEIRTFVKPDGVPIPEITTVGGWTPFWREEPDAVLYRPEMRVIDASNPNYLEPVLRLNDAGRGLAVFKLYSRHDAGYYKRFVLPAGLASLCAQVRGHAWYSQRDNAELSEYKDENDVWHTIPDFSPGLTLWIGIDPEGGIDPLADSIQWNFGRHYDGHGVIQSAVVFAPSSMITVFIRSTVDHPFKHADVYWANVWVSGYTDWPDAEPLPVPEPEPEPPTAAGWTVGREQYERTYVLMPPDCGKQWPQAAIAATWDTHRFTVGGSADDAGIGPEDRIVLAVNPGGWPSSLSAFYVTHYPGIEYVSLGAQSPEDLELVLEDYIHGGVAPDPEPEPPPADDEPQYMLRSNNLIGLHSGFTRAQSFPYIEQSGTTIQKFFSAGHAYEAAKIAPGIVSIWRKFVGNEQGRIWEMPTIRESAQWYLDLYTEEIETARANMGLTLAQFLERKISLESLNETIPTYNTRVLEASVEFDVHFAQLAHGRYGWAINTVLLCGAIGNPHESEVPLLLEAAIQAHRWGDFLGYHCYWTANRDRQFINEHWIYHAGRWMAWDTYFRSKGVYPRYASGEGGIVYAWDGTSFDSGKGWKACGSFEKYLVGIQRYNERVLAWNAEHGNRCAGLTLFGYGNWGWSNFELGDGEVILLNEWSKTL